MCTVVLRNCFKQADVKLKDGLSCQSRAHVVRSRVEKEGIGMQSGYLGFNDSMTC